MNRSVLHLSAVGASLALYGVARLLFNVIGLRTFGAEAIGEINVLLSASVLLSIPVTAGMAPALARQVATADAQHGPAANEIFRWAVGVSSLLLVLSLALHAGVVRWAGATAVPAGGLLVLWTAGYAFYLLNRSYYCATDRPNVALGLELAGFLVFALLLAVAAVDARFIWLPLLAYYLPGASRALLGLPVRRRPVVRRLPRREMLGFALFALLGSVASLGITYSSTIVMARGAGLEEAGLWATMLSALSPLLLLPRVLNMSFFPRLSYLAARSAKEFGDLSGVHQRLSSVVGLGLVGSLLLLLRPGLRWVVGPAAGDATAVTWWTLMLAVFALTRAEPLISGTMARGGAWLTAIVPFLSASGAVSVWVVGFDSWGGLAIAAGFGLFAFVTPALLHACRLSGRLRRHVPRTHFLPTDAALLLLAWACHPTLGPPAALAWGATAAAVGAAVHGAWRVYQVFERNPSMLSLGDLRNPTAP